MSIQFVFWFICLVWLLFDSWVYSAPTKPFYYIFGGKLLIAIMLVMLGWRVFGQPIHG